MSDHVTPERARKQSRQIRSWAFPYGIGTRVQYQRQLDPEAVVELCDTIDSLATQLEEAQEALLVAWKYTARAGLSNDQHNELDSIAGVVNAAYEQVKP